MINAGALSLIWLEGGKRRRKYVYGATAQEVRDQLLKARVDFAAGLPVVVERQTVSRFLQDWLENSVKPSVRPLTHEQYGQHVKLYLAPLLGTSPTRQTRAAARACLHQAETRGPPLAAYCPTLPRDTAESDRSRGSKTG